MSVADLLRYLRSRGVTLALEADGLHGEDPPEVVRRSLLADLTRHEGALINRLREEAEAQAATDKLGVMMAYWYKHQLGLSVEKYRWRRWRLLRARERPHPALDCTGEPREAYGWTVSPADTWRLWSDE